MFLPFILYSSALLVSGQTDLSTDSLTFSYYIASDLEDWVKGPSKPNGGKAVLAVGNPRWTANIPGAIWIWDSESVTDPTIVQTVHYFKEFFIPSVPLTASFTVSGDNKIWTYLNGESFGCDNLDGSWWAGSEKTCDALSKVNYGLNVLNITVVNNAVPGLAPGIGNNPGGALYKLSLTLS